jgi:REP element-mobilizing transposase RayT
VATVGNVNESTIVEYIKNQEKNDKLEDRGK